MHRKIAEVDLGAARQCKAVQCPEVGHMLTASSVTQKRPVDILGLIINTIITLYDSGRYPVNVLHASQPEVSRRRTDNETTERYITNEEKTRERKK